LFLDCCYTAFNVSKIKSCIATRVFEFNLMKKKDFKLLKNNIEIICIIYYQANFCFVSIFEKINKIILLYF